MGTQEIFHKGSDVQLTFEGFHQLEISKDIQKEEITQVKALLSGMQWL